MGGCEVAGVERVDLTSGANTVYQLGVSFIFVFNYISYEKARTTT